MDFDNFCNQLIEENEFVMPQEAFGSRGRPKMAAKKYVPSEKSYEMGFPPDGVEDRIIKFLQDTPATMDELVSFLHQNFDEYHAASACKEKIRQMLLNDVLDFEKDTSSDSDDEKGVPLLDPVDDEEPDLHQYIGGALDDYLKSSDLSDY